MTPTRPQSSRHSGQRQIKVQQTNMSRGVRRPIQLHLKDGPQRHFHQAELRVNNIHKEWLQHFHRLKKQLRLSNSHSRTPGGPLASSCKLRHTKNSALQVILHNCNNNSTVHCSSSKELGISFFPQMKNRSLEGHFEHKIYSCTPQKNRAAPLDQRKPST